MRCTLFIVTLFCMVLLTPKQVQAQSKIHIALSDPIAQYVWSEAYKPFINPQNTYAKQFLSKDYNSFWPDPTTAFRANLFLDPTNTFSIDMLNIVYFKESSSASTQKKKKRTSIAEYSLHWPVLLYEYYMYSGDEGVTRKMATEILPEVMEYFKDRMTRRGLLRSPAIWPESLRLGIDFSSMAKTEDAITNAFYYRALVASEFLYRQLGLDATEWRTKAHDLKSEYHKAFGQDSRRLFVDSIDTTNTSITTNALAICFGLTPESAYPETIELIRRYGIKCAPSMIPYVVEACFIAGESQLAIDLLSFMHDYKQNPSPLYLFPQYIFGATPESAGWTTVGITPRVPHYITSGELRIALPDGKLSLDYVATQGLHVTVPLESRVLVETLEGMNIVVKKYKSHTQEDTLTNEHLATLALSNREEWSGDATMIWVDVDTQMLRIINGNSILYHARCASATNGVGATMNSMRTPLGWHSVHSKLGDKAPWGQVFRSRIPTDEIWLPGKDTTEDLVLTRVILLTGEEPGFNQGGNVDSLSRYIYIHGTNDEAKIGTPSSHGCIRMTNDDVIDAYQYIEPGMKVLITASNN